MRDGLAALSSGLSEENYVARLLAGDRYAAGTDDVAFVRALYRDLLARDAEDQGLAHWVSRLAVGASRSEVALGVRTSDEFHRRTVDSALAGPEFTGLYQNYLERDGEQPGIDFWFDRLHHGAGLRQVQAGFLESDEFFACHDEDIL